MGDLFGLLFSAALVNNLVLTHLIGLDLQVAASRRINAAWLIGLATTYCLTLIIPLIHVLNHLVIIPLGLQYLALFIYVMSSILIVLFSQTMMHRFFPLISQQVDTVVPILLVNSTLLAMILIQQDINLTFFDSILYGFCNGLGFLFILLVLTCLRERLDNNDIPVPFRGIPILLIALGIFSMGLMGLSGLQ